MVNACLDGSINAGELELVLSVKIEIDNERMSEILHELEEAQARTICQTRIWDFVTKRKNVAELAT